MSIQIDRPMVERMASGSGAASPIAVRLALKQSTMASDESAKV